MKDSIQDHLTQSTLACLYHVNTLLQFQQQGGRQEQQHEQLQLD